MRTQRTAVLIGFLSMFLTGAVVSAEGLPQTVAWEVLGDMTYKDDGKTFFATFSPRVQKLKDKEIIVAGYMIPVEPSEMQGRFVLSGLPLAGCTFCGGGGGEPETYIEVTVVDPFRFTYDPIALKGKLIIVDQDEWGLFYRLHKATPVKLAAAELQKLLIPTREAAYQVEVDEGPEKGDKVP
ncbi:MAG: hypothetical protein CME19_13910 [Gemmatimonadetes bacterium]|nr:hypothetical protein [Gemmatimonadota bacterium]|tara:strand:- start:13 stop:558 length:546 start_codon:yes stop_codon:yes gene_type:complete